MLDKWFIDTFYDFSGLFTGELDFVAVFSSMFIIFFIAWTLHKVSGLFIIFGKHFLSFLAFMFLPFIFVLEIISIMRRTN